MTFNVGDLVRYHNAYLKETRYGVVTATGTIGLQWVRIDFGDGESSTHFVEQYPNDIEKIS